MKFSNTIKYGYRRHSGGLDESLKTKVYIRSDSFMNMLKTGRYTPYGFDDRCNQVLWLCYDNSLWLFIELVSYDN